MTIIWVFLFYNQLNTSNLLFQFTNNKNFSRVKILQIFVVEKELFCSWGVRGLIHYAFTAKPFSPAKVIFNKPAETIQKNALKEKKKIGVIKIMKVIAWRATVQFSNETTAKSAGNIQRLKKKAEYLTNVNIPQPLNREYQDWHQGQ